MTIETPRYYEQWINWVYQGKHKTPINPITGRRINMTDAHHWMTYGEARDYSRQIGFVLTPDDPWIVVDIDHHDDHPLVAALDSYTELSPSGNGLHIWLRRTDDQQVARNLAGVELYSDTGYVTVTGHHVIRTPRSIRTIATPELLTILGVDATATTETPPQSRTAPTRDDDALWAHICQYDQKGRVGRLYRGELDCVQGNHSLGVIILCSTLARYTNGNRDRIRRMMHQTALVSDKWVRACGDTTWIEHQITQGIAYKHKRQVTV